MMRSLTFLALACTLAGPAQAADPACDRKAAEIERQIGYAQEAGNRARLDGLRKALAANRENCTDSRLIQGLEQDIAEQQEEIDALRAEVREKESEGRYDKVKKLERKLADAQQDLKDLQQSLAEMGKP
ncbi:MAG: DUF1090 domain-containing protein [Castellaniella sp.]|uniref:DUF1090 domain-containing protein n=1 Tax=Castellaniella sp. TaxID=1955812 RepID=UPI003C740FCE